MTQYLFSVIHDYVNNPPIADPVKDAEMFKRVGDFNNTIKDKILFMGGLHAPESAFSALGSMLTEGPFAEANEMIGGLWVIEADEDEVRDLARRASEACGVKVEVRPFQSI